MPVPDRHGRRDFARELLAALEQRMGPERFRLWITRSVRVEATDDSVVLWVDSSFAMDRLRSRHLRDVHSAVEEVYGRKVDVSLLLDSERAVSDANERVSLDANPAPRVRPTVGPTRPPVTDGLLDRKGGSRIRVIEGAAIGRSTVGPASATPHADSVLEGVSSKRRKPPELSAVSPPTLAKPMGAGSSVTPRVAARMDDLCGGQCNRLALTSARMVLDAPGTVNPFYVWGPHGVGKTYLLQALQDELRGRHGFRRVILLSAEEFTNDFMAALGGSGLPSFRRRYREVDTLLIDDVQFFSGKKATLREVLFTVDTLIRGRKQLGFAADRPPMELEGWGGELTGRLSAGMVASVQALDLETRRAILERRIGQIGLRVTPEVIDQLAQQLGGDARSLLGAANRLRLVQQVGGATLDWQAVRGELSDLLEAGRAAVGLADIQKAVCDAFGLPSGALQSREQRRAVSEPRMLAMFLARRLTQSAFSEIGRYFGKRSHSTVIAAEKCVQRWLEDGTSVEGPDRRLPIRQAIATIEGRLRTG
jgi:chromosomal replication initiator protein